jgi:hypothetical protein
VIDGEAVCCDEAGVANFERLHSRAHDGQSSMALTIGGSRTRRKAKLEKLLRKSAAGIACKLGFEGSSQSTGSTLIDRVQARLG